MNHKTCRIVTLTSVFLCVASLAFANARYTPHSRQPVGAPRASSPPYSTDHILVQFKDASLRRSKLNVVPFQSSPSTATGFSSVDAIGKQLGAVSISRSFIEPANAAEGERLGIHRWYTIRLPAGSDIPAAVKLYTADPNVERATPDWLGHTQAVPTDPAYPQHWGHNNTAQLPGYDWGGTYDHTLLTTVGTPGFDAHAQLGWDGIQGYGSSGVIIAIVDTGCNLSHPDLSFVAGYDFGDNDSNPEDNCTHPVARGHGTCCAGVAAAKANNGLGACGVAPGCKIMPMKAITTSGNLPLSAVANCVIWAADHGANIISMSLGYPVGTDPAADPAFVYATNAGVTLLGAAGNWNRGILDYPAINANVIAVGAASPCGERKRSSSVLSELNQGVGIRTGTRATASAGGDRAGATQQLQMRVTPPMSSHRPFSTRLISWDPRGSGVATTSHISAARPARPRTPLAYVL